MEKYLAQSFQKKTCIVGLFGLEPINLQSLGALQKTNIVYFYVWLQFEKNIWHRISQITHISRWKLRYFCIHWVFKVQTINSKYSNQCNCSKIPNSKTWLFLERSLFTYVENQTCHTLLCSHFLPVKHLILIKILGPLRRRGAPAQARQPIAAGKIHKHR